VKKGSLISKLRDVFYGAFVSDLVSAQGERWKELNDLLILSLFGDWLFGLPFFHSYYAPRLFPYFSKSIKGFKRRLLREKDIVEKFGKEDIS